MIPLYSLLALFLFYVFAPRPHVRAVMEWLLARLRSAGAAMKNATDETDRRALDDMTPTERGEHFKRHGVGYAVASVVLLTMLALSIATAIAIGVALARVYAGVAQ